MADDGGTGGEAAAAGDDGKAANPAAGQDGGAGGQGQQGGADAGQNGGQQAAAPELKTLLGDLGEDAMFQPFKDVAGLAKAYKDTKQMLGKAQGIPGETASPEEKSAFYKALGVPETADGYDLKAPEGLPEKLAQVYSTEMLGEFKKVAKELNLTPAQAAGLQKWQDGYMQSKIEGLQGDIQRTDEAFEAEMVKAFGSKEKAEASQAVAQTLVEKYLSPDMRASLNGLPENALGAIAMIANGLSQDMTGEDFTLGKPDGGDGKYAGKSIEQLREDGKAIMRGEAFKNGLHKDHKQAVADKDEIYAQIARMGGAQPDGGKGRKGK